MGLFSAIFRRRFHPLWEYSAKGVIWRIFPSDTGYFVGEERDLKEKTVSFFCLDRKNGAVLWEGLRAADPWWITVDAVHDNMLFLHGYAEPDMPEPRKIFAYDIRTGSPAWSDESSRFLFASGESVYAVREETLGPKFFRLGLADGKVLDELQSDDIHRLKRTIHQPDNTSARFPVPAGDGKSGAAGKFGGMAGVEVLDVPGSTVVGYYARARGAGDKLVHHLAVLGPGGRREIDEVIDADVSAPVPDTFFCMDDMLYFIREKHILTGVRLPSRGGNR